jgi:hypothetical protein
MLQQVHAGQLTTSNVRHKLSLDFHQNVNGQADLILQHGKKAAHANKLSMSNKSMQHDGMVSCSLSTWAFSVIIQQKLNALQHDTTHMSVHAKQMQIA